MDYFNGLMDGLGLVYIWFIIIIMITQNYSKCHYLEPYSWLMTCFYIPSPCFMGNILKNNWTKSLRFWAFFNWWFIYLFVEQIHWWFRTYVCVCVYIYVKKTIGVIVIWNGVPNWLSKSLSSLSPNSALSMPKFCKT